MHKIKNKTAPSSFLEKFEKIRIQHTFQVGITENHKLNYTYVHFEFRIWQDFVVSTEKVPSSLVKTKMKKQFA